jgi:hypothetical protein
MTGRVRLTVCLISLFLSKNQTHKYLSSGLKLTDREGSSDRKEKNTELEQIGDEENVQNYIYIYIYNNMTYLCTTWLGQLRKPYNDVQHFPLLT